MDDRQRLAKSFHEDLREEIRVLCWDIGYRPPRLEELLNLYGAVEAVRRILRSPRASEGFGVLAHHGMLHRSIEAWALRPEYRDLFTHEERDVARRRLERQGFPVDSYLHAFTPQRTDA
jgi:hypothetical protein